MGTAYVSPSVNPGEARVQYWAKVRSAMNAIVEKLGKKEWVYIAAQQLDELTGEPLAVPTRVFEVRIDVAAKCLAARTHRLARDPEIQDFLKDRERRTLECARTEAERPNSTSPAATGRAMAEALREVMQNQKPAAVESAPQKEKR
jgi:hypothetical protein